MSDGREQLEGLRRDARRWAMASGVVLIGGSVWAFWPRAVAAVNAVQLRAPPAPSTQAAVPRAVALDLKAFDAPIWNPTPPVKPAAPLPPLRLQLVAITRELAPDGTARFRAAVYDPDVDAMSQVLVGERLAGRSVLRITATGLEISDTSGSRTLLLDAGWTGGKP